MLTPAQLTSRLELDWEVVSAMACPSFTGRAYGSRSDLAADRNPITSKEAAGSARAYRLRFEIPTLAGPDRIMPVTEIGLDIPSSEYPVRAPSVWVLSDPVPWSPHFNVSSRSVCIGSMWTDAKGRALVGHLVAHLARILNWDEDVQGGRAGYGGFNPEAVQWWLARGGGPLDPNVRYPMLPGWLHGSAPRPSTRFELEPVLTPSASPTFEWSM